MFFSRQRSIPQKLELDCYLHELHVPHRKRFCSIFAHSFAECTQTVEFSYPLFRFKLPHIANKFSFIAFDVLFANFKHTKLLSAQLERSANKRKGTNCVDTFIFLRLLPNVYGALSLHSYWIDGKLNSYFPLSFILFFITTEIINWRKRMKETTNCYLAVIFSLHTHTHVRKCIREFAFLLFSAIYNQR